MMQKKTTTNSSIRAEELIVTIYKKKLDLQEKGKIASRIIMSMEFFKKIKIYHLGLGEVQGELGDYITDDEIFGIPVFIDHVEEIIVE